MGPTLPPMDPTLPTDGLAARLWAQRCLPACLTLPTGGLDATHLRAQYCPPACLTLRHRVLAKDLWAARVRSLRRFSIAETKIWVFFATFLRLGTPFRLCKAKTGCCEAAHLRFYAADPRLGALRQSLIAKKLQSRSIFCFWILVRVQSGMVPLVGLPLSPPFAPKASEWGRIALKSKV